MPKKTDDGKKPPLTTVTPISPRGQAFHLPTKHCQRQVMALQLIIDSSDVRQYISFCILLFQTSSHPIEGIIRLIVKGLSTLQSVDQGDTAGAEIRCNVFNTRSCMGRGRGGTQFHRFGDDCRELGDGLDVFTVEGVVLIRDELVFIKLGLHPLSLLAFANGIYSQMLHFCVHVSVLSSDTKEDDEGEAGDEVPEDGCCEGECFIVE